MVKKQTLYCILFLLISPHLLLSQPIEPDHLGKLQAALIDTFDNSMALKYSANKCVEIKNLDINESKVLEIKEKADQGDSVAQCQIGLIYKIKNKKELSLKYLKKSALNKNQFALLLLAKHLVFSTYNKTVLKMNNDRMGSLFKANKLLRHILKSPDSSYIKDVAEGLLFSVKISFSYTDQYSLPSLAEDINALTETYLEKNNASIFIFKTHLLEHNQLPQEALTHLKKFKKDKTLLSEYINFKLNVLEIQSGSKKPNEHLKNIRNLAEKGNPDATFFLIEHGQVDLSKKQSLSLLKNISKIETNQKRNLVLSLTEAIQLPLFAKDALDDTCINNTSEYCDIIEAGKLVNKGNLEEAFDFLSTKNMIMDSAHIYSSLIKARTSELTEEELHNLQSRLEKVKIINFDFFFSLQLIFNEGQFYQQSGNNKLANRLYHICSKISELHPNPNFSLMYSQKITEKRNQQ